MEAAGEMGNDGFYRPPHFSHSEEEPQSFGDIEFKQSLTKLQDPNFFNSEYFKFL